MIIQATSHGTAAKEEPFAFTYSGDFTDNRDENGIGTVRLNTSGTLTVTGSPVTVSAYILGAGSGGAAINVSGSNFGNASGGGGGIQTVEVTLEAGTYDIVIGIGGTGVYLKTSSYEIVKSTAGGSTTAFGYTSTGGNVATAAPGSMNRRPGAGGTPNGTAGDTNDGLSQLAGGSPNGGYAYAYKGTVGNGGDGYVEITFS